jgi:hypothetical protein
MGFKTQGVIMEDDRIVQKQLRIFDILNYRSQDLPDMKSIRIMHEYDDTHKRQEFTVLNSEISIDSAEKIIVWLKENMENDELIYGLDSNEIDFVIADKESRKH